MATPTAPTAHDPTVQVALSHYQCLRDNEKALQAQVYQLQQDLAAAKLADPTGMLKLAHAAFEDALRVVQFAVGNLDPQTVAKWPHEALTRVANAIDQLPGIDRHLSEMSEELRTFAKQAASYEEFRRERDKHRVVVAASASDFGPKTDEAARAHAEYAARVGATDTPTSASATTAEGLDAPK